MSARLCPHCGSKLTSILVGETASTAKPWWKSALFSYREYCPACRGELVRVVRTSVVLPALLGMLIAAYLHAIFKVWAIAHIEPPYGRVASAVAWVLFMFPSTYAFSFLGSTYRAPNRR